MIGAWYIYIIYMVLQLAKGISNIQSQNINSPIKQMVNLSIKWFGVWLMRDESELGHSVARPARRLTLPVALEEEAQRLLLLAVRRRRLPRHHHDLPRQVADVAWRRQDWILEVPEVMYSEAERRFWTRIVILHFGVKTSQLQDSWVNWNMGHAFCDNFSTMGLGHRSY